jgi:hypothetical protein
VVQPATAGVATTLCGRFLVWAGTIHKRDDREQPTSKVHENMPKWLRKRPFSVRILAYAAAAILAFALAAGVGAIAALTLGDDLGFSEREEPRPTEEQGNAQQGEERGNAERGNARQSEAEYVSTVGDIQARAVETLLDSHNKLLRYDALTVEDVEELKANEAALRGLSAQVDDLAPPQNYEEQYEVFRSAIDELHEAARLAYELAADPVAATESGFDRYDSHLNEAAALLERSNELLGRDYKTVEGAQEISPQLSTTETLHGSEGA